LVSGGLDVEIFVGLPVDNLEEAEWLPSAPILSCSRRFIGSLIKSPEVIKEGVEGGIDVIAPPVQFLFHIRIVVIDVLQIEGVIEDKIRDGGIE
jgi:hypothetical protein